MIKNLIGIVFWSFCLFLFVTCISNIIGCVAQEVNYKPPPMVISATEIEGNLIEINYIGQETKILLIFEDSRELVLISTSYGYATYPLKKGYVKIKHSSGRIREVYEKDDDGEWKEVR